jgi:glycosyltransferase involved in cell wall biosynthesis
MILDAIRLNKPFIVTKETGIAERIKDIAIFVDPENPDDIQEKILWLLDAQNHAEQKKKIESFTFTHTWEDMAREYVDLFNSLSN